MFKLVSDAYLFIHSFKEKQEKQDTLKYLQWNSIDQFFWIMNLKHIKSIKKQLKSITKLQLLIAKFITIIKVSQSYRWKQIIYYYYLFIYFWQ